MIDDDSFNDIVRRMFEQFFGGTFRVNPNDSNVQVKLGMGRGSTASKPAEEPFIDVLDFENEIMIIIATTDEIKDPEANIRSGLLGVRLNPMSTNQIQVELQSSVDVSKSQMTFSNGTIEIRLAKTNEKQKEGVLSVSE